MMDKFRDTKTALDTCLPFISYTIWIRDGPYYLPILDLELELTANTTIGANCGNYTIRLCNPTGS
ncbi:hypothetical protein ES703_96750 [subsurface metagenome]